MLKSTLSMTCREAIPKAIDGTKVPVVEMTLQSRLPGGLFLPGQWGMSGQNGFYRRAPSLDAAHQFTLPSLRLLFSNRLLVL